MLSRESGEDDVPFDDEAVNGEAERARQPEQAERAVSLQAALERRLFLAEYVRDVVLVVSQADGRIVAANSAAVSAYGYARDELLTLRVSDLRAPEQRALVPGQMKEAARGGILFEAVHQRKDGTTFPVEVSTRGDEIDGEKVLVSVVRDVTERKRVEAEREQLLAQLDAERTRWKATVEGMLDHLAICDAAGRVTYVNPAYERAVGRIVEPGLPIERHPDYYQLYHSDGTLFAPTDLPLQRAALYGEAAQGVEVVHRAADGCEFVSVMSASPLRDETGRIVGAVGVGRDVTEERRAAAERERLLAQLREANEHLMAASAAAQEQAARAEAARAEAERQAVELRELQQAQELYLHAISHDLRNPLTGILGHCQMIQRYPARAELIAKSAAFIDVSARRMNSMIRDLVDSARLDSGKLVLNLAPVDLTSFIFDLVERLGDADQRARVRVELPEIVPPVTADPDRLERVLANLVGNALKYSESDSPVTVTALQERNEVMVAVRDHGVGIPLEDLPHLFERYYRSRDTHGRDGLGLGLYIARQIVEAQGGRIWAESETGAGSTFYFTLPLA